MPLLDNSVLVKSYVISTAKSGVGEKTDSDTTPRGKHEIAEKFGANEPIGMVFVERKPTAEIVEINTPGRWLVVTRILQLRSLEDHTLNGLSTFMALQWNICWEVQRAAVVYACAL